MPAVDKSERRERQRRKARDAKFMGARYTSMRAGEGLAKFEAERKTTADGKPVKKKKRK